MMRILLLANGKTKKQNNGYSNYRFDDGQPIALYVPVFLLFNVLINYRHSYLLGIFTSTPIAQPSSFALFIVLMILVACSNRSLFNILRNGFRQIFSFCLFFFFV